MSHANHEDNFSLRATVVCVHFCEHDFQVLWVTSCGVREHETWYKDMKCNSTEGSQTGELMWVRFTQDDSLANIRFGLFQFRSSGQLKGVPIYGLSL